MNSLDDLPLFTQRPLMGHRARLEEEFQDFHADNPHVYEHLVKFARRAKRAGAQKIGIATLYERLRWSFGLDTTTTHPKLNNNHRAFYARLIMAQCPDLQGFFELREQKHQSSH